VKRPNTRARRELTEPRPQQERLLRTVVVAAIVVSVGGFALIASARNGGSSVNAVNTAAPGPGSTKPAAAPASTAAPAVDVAATESSVPDLAIAATELTADCVVPPKSITVESEPLDVQCLQQALVREGFYNGQLSGQFDFATSAAVEALQIERNLYVDGVAGRETGIELEIWPEEKLEVVRTPAPAAGAEDSWGFLLSSVSSTGAGAPPLPENSGSGRRIVYERISQRVWAVSAEGEIIRSWLVSGSQYSNEVPGTHQVYSRSEQSTAWNGKDILPLMVRWYRTDIGALGFHAIPIRVSDGGVYQTEDELGTRLSGGCQRQANRDAQFMWAFAEVGTTVVVL